MPSCIPGAAICILVMPTLVGISLAYLLLLSICDNANWKVGSSEKIKSLCPDCANGAAVAFEIKRAFTDKFPLWPDVTGIEQVQPGDLYEKGRRDIYEKFIKDAGKAAEAGFPASYEALDHLNIRTALLDKFARFFVEEIGKFNRKSDKQNEAVVPVDAVDETDQADKKSGKGKEKAVSADEVDESHSADKKRGKGKEMAVPPTESEESDKSEESDDTEEGVGSDESEKGRTPKFTFLLTMLFDSFICRILSKIEWLHDDKEAMVKFMDSKMHELISHAGAIADEEDDWEFLGAKYQSLVDSIMN
ncbi:hypothetical protein BKA67DRAFT_566434 [Truncatella angustata]|uniref:Uncharacterized protein n=1 Tax=Truncatella angustata TaxID=152316 RepID=A0A9P8UMX9_9PEZI|nr:uncharacterized protein BKA67DRAFT_566434 [Truncatella angustata]KAH6654855.1 hypothetical protein BKA67DRAFT_566434 [Truncatella angustata]